MNRLDKEYQMLLEYILGNGVEKKDRTGTGTISVFGTQIRHNMSDGFPLLTTKKMAIKTMMTELKWFLKGDTNIKYLVDNGCNIWNGDAYKAFKSTFSPMPGIQSSLPSQEEFINKIKTNDEFAEKWGDLGPIYGKQWREWSPVAGEINKGGKDQIKELIKNLKENPDSRRLMVSAWNVGELGEVVLPPCHYGFQCYTHELSYKERYKIWFRNNYETGMEYNSDSIPNFEDEYYTPTPKRTLSLMWNQRSVDTFLGLPFNIASYGTLLQLIADECNMIAGELIGNLGDTHLYKNHIQQAKEQILRSSFKLPTIKLSNVDILSGEWDYEIEGYEYHPTIKAPLSN
jgi:thymidylate synthase